MNTPQEKTPGENPPDRSPTPHTQIVFTGHRPIVTQFATGMMIALYLLIFGFPLPEMGQYPVLYNTFSSAMIWQGNAWLLLLIPFVHTSLFHLFCCCVAFWLVGSVVERVLGHRFMFGLLFFGALFTGGAQLMTTDWPIFGASPIIFALFGTVLAARRSHLEFHIALAVPPLNRFWLWLAGFSLLGFVGFEPNLGLLGVGNVAQAAGLLFGVAVGWLAGGGTRRLVAASVVFLLFAAATISSVSWMPWRLDWQLYQYERRIEAGDYQSAMHILERLDQDNASVLNALAWTQATARDASVRDGQAAIERARAALRATEWSQPEVIDTLAAAYAETGNWEMALATQKIAVAAQRRLEMLDLSPHASTRLLEENLKTLEKHEPVRN